MTLKIINIISYIVGIISLCVLALISTKAFIFGLLFGSAMTIQVINEIVPTLKGEKVNEEKFYVLHRTNHCRNTVCNIMGLIRYKSNDIRDFNICRLLYSRLGRRYDEE